MGAECVSGDVDPVDTDDEFEKLVGDVDTFALAVGRWSAAADDVAVIVVVVGVVVVVIIVVIVVVIVMVFVPFISSSSTSGDWLLFSGSGGG